ncbi:MAG TPA: hypothetical protein GX704_02330 [Clostridiales bacterium]|nr:hypothetical protein [Clostridiales bacterium]
MSGLGLSFAYIKFREKAGAAGRHFLLFRFIYLASRTGVRVTAFVHAFLTSCGLKIINKIRTQASLSQVSGKIRSIAGRAKYFRI